MQKKKELLKESEGSEVLKGDEVSDKIKEFYGKKEVGRGLEVNEEGIGGGGCDHGRKEGMVKGIKRNREEWRGDWDGELGLARGRGEGRGRELEEK